MDFGTRVALHDIDLVARRGEIVGVVGPDGAGKTTLLRILAGVLVPTGGKAVVLGRDLRGEAEALKADVGYLSQRFSLYDDLTVAENMAFFADLHHVPEAMQQARGARLFAASRLDPFRSRLAQHLSGGMRQKLGLICALIHSPRLLLLDEPTTGVDPVSRREFWQLLLEMADDGTTMLIATPYMDEAQRCHRVALLDAGRLVAFGSPTALLAAMSHTVIEIATSQPSLARATLSEAADIRSVEMYGDRIHATVDAAPDLPAMKSRLAAAGVADATLGVVQPTLEDVYIDLTGGAP